MAPPESIREAPAAQLDLDHLLGGVGDGDMPGEVVNGDGLTLGFGLPVGGAPLGVGALEGEVGDVGGG